MLASQRSRCFNTYRGGRSASRLGGHVFSLEALGARRRFARNGVSQVSFVDGDSFGRGLPISVEEGELKWRHRLAGFRRGLLGFSAIATLVSLFGALSTPWTSSRWGCFLPSCLSSLSWTPGAAYQRLEDRLIDRAYLLSKSASEQPRP